MRFVIKTWNLNTAERALIVEALITGGSLVEAATLLGITRHGLKRRIIKYGIPWTRGSIEPVREVIVPVDLERPNERIARAERTFSWLAKLVPYHVWYEETGDALEAIAKMEKAGCSAFKIRFKVWSTIFVLLFNGLREGITALLASRKSPLK